MSSTILTIVFLSLAGPFMAAGAQHAPVTSNDGPNVEVVCAQQTPHIAGDRGPRRDDVG